MPNETDISEGNISEPSRGMVVVDRKKLFSESHLWKLQRKYYESLRSDAAVAKCSAFSVSSNCYLAKVNFVLFGAHN